jgi:hypothetical protein
MIHRQGHVDCMYGFLNFRDFHGKMFSKKRRGKEVMVVAAT